MANRTKTYWVEYSYKYEYFDAYSKHWEKDSGFKARRFQCRKANIKQEVEKYLLKFAFEGEIVSNLVITIKDCYETTEHEI